MQKVVAVKIRLYHLMVVRSSEMVRSRQADLLFPVVYVIGKVMGMTGASQTIHTPAQDTTAHRIL